MRDVRSAAASMIVWQGGSVCGHCTGTPTRSHVCCPPVAGDYAGRFASGCAKSAGSGCHNPRFASPTPAARSGARRPLSVAATAGARVGMRGGRRAPAPMGCAGPAGGGRTVCRVRPDRAPSATIAHCENGCLRFQESARKVCHPIDVPLLPSEREGKRFLNPVPTTVAGISILFKAGPRILFGRAARLPKYALGPFHTDASVFAKSPDSGLRVTWIGHSTSLVEVDGIRLLIDPVWDERAAPMQWTGPKRFFPAPLALEDLPPIDAVLISHDHYDHLGAGTIRRLAHMEKLRKARWIATLGVEDILRALGVDPTRCTALNWTGKATIGSVTITALPARHFSGRSLFNRFETLWASFAVTGPRHRIYYGADSGEWPGFRNIGEEFGPFDLTMLEIGASNPLWPDIHMGPEGAVRSFRCSGWPRLAHAHPLGAIRSSAPPLDAANRESLRSR